MSTPSKGLGVSPLGTAAYGYGQPATTPEPGGRVYVDSQGVRRGSRKLRFGDNSTSIPFRKGGKYEYDDKGMAVGSADVDHLVTVAALMIKGSSAAYDVGNRFYEARHITPNLQKEQEANVAEAFKSLVDQRLIRIESVRVETRGYVAVTHIRIRDLTTNTLLDELTV
jgi:hypothetical protein